MSRCTGGAWVRYCESEISNLTFEIEHRSDRTPVAHSRIAFELYSAKVAWDPLNENTHDIQILYVCVPDFRIRVCGPC